MHQIRFQLSPRLRCWWGSSQRSHWPPWLDFRGSCF